MTFISEEVRKLESLYSASYPASIFGPTETVTVTADEYVLSTNVGTYIRFTTTVTTEAGDQFCVDYKDGTAVQRVAAFPQGDNWAAHQWANPGNYVMTAWLERAGETIAGPNNAPQPVVITAPLGGTVMTAPGGGTSPYAWTGTGATTGFATEAGDVFRMNWNDYSPLEDIAAVVGPAGTVTPLSHSFTQSANPWIDGVFRGATRVGAASSPIAITVSGAQASEQSAPPSAPEPEP